MCSECGHFTDKLAGFESSRFLFARETCWSPFQIGLTVPIGKVLSVLDPPLAQAFKLELEAKKGYPNWPARPLKFSAPQAGVVGSQIAKEFKLNSTYMITGTFTSTYGAEIYIAPTNAMSNSTRFPPRFYTYSTGNVTSGNVSVTLSSGSYYLVIADQTTVSDNITSLKALKQSLFSFSRKWFL